MINLLQLREVIEGAIATDIGSYRFATGQTAPAIATLIGKENYPPAGTQTTGIECVILVDMAIGIENVQGGFRKTYRAAIALKQWSSDEGAKDVIDLLEPLMDAIQMQMPELSIMPNSVRGLMAERNLNNLEMVQFSIAQIEESYSY